MKDSQCKFVRVPNRDVIKTFEGVEVKFHAFITSIRN